MAKIVLRYWRCQGRAEPLRVLLVDSGVPFEDEYQQVELWHQHQKDASKSGPFRSLPVLHWDNYQVAQTEAIAGYLAAKLGYAGDGSPEQAAQSAALCSAAYQDLLQPTTQFIYSPDTNPQIDLEKKFDDTARQMHGRLRNLDELLGEKNFFLNGDRPCAGDIFLYVVFDVFQRVFGDPFFAAFPRLTNFHKRIGARPNIKAYAESDRKFKRICFSTKEDEVLEKAKGFSANLKF